MRTIRRLLLGLLALGLHGIMALGQEPQAAAPSGAWEFVDGPANDANGGPGWMAGVGLYLVQPYFENNPAFNVLSETQVKNNLLPPSGIVTGTTANRVSVSQHLQAAPLVWLGYQGADGLGARARYWYFRQGTDQSIDLAPFTGEFSVSMDKKTVKQLSGTLYTVTSATPQGLQAFGNTLSRDFGPQGTTFNVQTKLEAQVGDLEVSQLFQFGRWDILASGGLRVVRLVQTYNVYEKETSGPLEFRSLLSSYDFTGAGPVFAMELRRDLGDTGLYFVTNARAAVVTGSAQQDATYSGLRLRNEDPNPQQAEHHWTRGLPIAELEVGLEYARNIGGSQVFAQVALVGQEWFGAGNSSRSTGLSPPHSPNPVVGGAPVDSNLAFFGAAFRLGWNY